jgi:hypothetical protein
MNYKNYDKSSVKPTFDLGGKRKTRADDDFEDGDDDDYDNRSGIFVKRKSVYSFDYYLDSYIGAPSLYRGLFQCIGNMQEQDELFIHVNSGGGRLDTAMQLIDAMHSTNGDITVVVTGTAGSAAGMVALHAPSLVITPSSQFLAHNASTGTGGKLGEVVSSVEFSKKYIDKLIKDTYSGFMTEQEIEYLKIGKDFWFNSDEIIERLEIRETYWKEKKVKEDEEEAKKIAVPSKPKPKVKAKAKK